jgi:hypothetical protein
VFKAVRAKSPTKLGKPELLEVLNIFEDFRAQLDATLCPRPKSIAKCTERELVQFVIDELYGNELGESFYHDDRLLAAAKRYGVNVAKIKKELTAKAEAKLKEAAASAAKKKGKK